MNDGQRIINKKFKYKNINGKRIRRQYFNLFVYAFAIVMLMVSVFSLLVNLFGGVPNKPDMGYTFGVIIRLAIGIEAPLIVLSLFNRIFFGKVVCVLNSEGIYHKDGFISWECVDSIEYNAEIPARHMQIPNSARVIGKNTNVRIISAPYYLLRKAKKYKRTIKTGFSDDGKFVLITAFAVPLVICIIIYFLKRTQN